MDEFLVTIDDASDRSRASDRISRYGAYLRQATGEFRSWDSSEVADPITFAAAAWRNATGPVMGPGYAEIRADINSICITSGESGEGDYAIEITIPLDHRALKPLGSHRGLPDLADWHREGLPFSDYKGYWDPKYTRPALLTTTRLLIPLTETMLPTPDPSTPVGTVNLADAKAAVHAIATIVNNQAGPVVDALRSVR